MAETIKFEDNRQGRPALCLACEEMLADAVDETLSPADQAFFDRHVAGCVDCSRMVAEAQRGAAWLTLLKTAGALGGSDGADSGSDEWGGSRGSA